MQDISLRKKKKIINQIIKLLIESKDIKYNDKIKDDVEIPDWALQFKPENNVLSEEEFNLLIKVLEESINNQKLLSIILYDILPIIIKILSKIIISGTYIIDGIDKEEI